MTGPVLTHVPNYKARVIDAVLGGSQCAAPVPSSGPHGAAQTSCPQGRAAVSAYQFVITAPNGQVTYAHHLQGHTQSGDQIQASFTIVPLPRGCSSVQVALASYVAPSDVMSWNNLRRQVLSQADAGFFGAGPHQLALQVDVPSVPWSPPSPTPTAP